MTAAGAGCRETPAFPPRRRVYASTDGGASWLALSDDIAGDDVYALLLAPDSPTAMFAGTRGSGALRSTDGGFTWWEMNDGLAQPDIYALALNPGGTTLFAGSDRLGVFAYTLPVAPSADPTGSWLHAGTASGVFGFPPSGTAAAPLHRRPHRR